MPVPQPYPILQTAARLVTNLIVDEGYEKLLGKHVLTLWLSSTAKWV